MFFLFSCSHLPNTTTATEGASALFKPKKVVFRVQESSGDYLLEKEVGFVEKKHFATKRLLKSYSGPQKMPLEKSISISTPGPLDGVNLLRPYKSQYLVWLDKKKHSSTVKVLPQGLGLELTMASPDSQHRGKKVFELPPSQGPYCFFFQIVECVGRTGFLSTAIENPSKEFSIDLTIIWEGYPFIGQQYQGIPDSLFSPATLVYEGRNDSGEHRLTLNFADQAIIYLVDSKYRFSKMFWVAHGLSTTFERASWGLSAGPEGPKKL